MTAPFVLCLLAILSSFKLAFAQQTYTYFVHDSCRYWPIKEAMDEIKWATQGLLRDLPTYDIPQAASVPRIDDWLQWFFGFDGLDADPTGSPYAKYFRETIERISQLTPASSLRNSDVRIYCDGMKRFLALDPDGTVSAQQPDYNGPAFDSRIFLDEDNENLSLGARLENRRDPDRAAAVGLRPQASWDQLRGRFRPAFPPARQNAYRHTIDFTDGFLGLPGSSLLWKDMAKAPLDLFADFPTQSMFLSITLLHELCHVQKLSDTFLPLVSATGHTTIEYLEQGLDHHPPVNPYLNGYYYPRSRLMPGEVLNPNDPANPDFFNDPLALIKTNAFPGFSITNPDSYAFMITAHVFWRKGWNDFRDGITGLLSFRRDNNRQPEPNYDGTM